MKTKNNVQKTILKSLAILTSLVLLSYTLSAQGLWKQLFENSSATFAMAFTNSATPETVKSNLWASSSIYNSNETEAELELESWMTDANFFAANSLMEKEAEAPLELENWMTAETFGMKTAVLTEADNSLEVEDWMLENNFGVEIENDSENKNYRSGSFVYREIEEPKLQFEAWMFDTNHFKVR